MTQPATSTDYLTSSDVETLIAATQSSRTKAILGLWFETGLRLAELTNLELADVNPANSGRGFVVIVTPRTTLNTRSVRLIKYAHEVQDYLERGYVGDRDGPTQRPHGEEQHPLSKDHFCQILKQAVTQTDIEKQVTPVDIRLGGVHRLYLIGMPELYIRRRCGYHIPNALPSPSSEEVNQWYEQKMENPVNE